MDDSANHPRTPFRVAAALALILVVALGLRVGAAVVVTRYVEGLGKLCVFGDTKIYWDLARAIVAGEPYVVIQFGSPHYALRTPGYPLFLAACQAIFGENFRNVRFVQAFLGALSVWLVVKLARAVLRRREDTAAPPPQPSPTGGEGVKVDAKSPPPQPSPTGGEGVNHDANSPPPQPSPTGGEGAKAASPPQPSPTGGEGVRQDAPPQPSPTSAQGAKVDWVPVIAGALAAVHPYLVALSALVLSEALFLPLMMLGLWGLARLWDKTKPVGFVWIASGTGLAMGGAILARPSWALFVPMVLASWVIGAGWGSRWRAIRGSVIVALATAAILTPWWIRNERVIGRFVPTALWVGASLYDGISPQANGASAMEFVEAPEVRSLGEVEQDALFRERSVEFAKAHPARVVELAAIKLGRFWSPWPNADTLRSRWVTVGSAAVTLPIFAMIALGVIDRRRDFRALVLLAGPLLYFCVLHMVFVSSIRYRIPGELPAMALASIGLGRILKGLRSMSVRRRIRKWLGWTLVLALSVLMGGAVAAYFYATDSDTLADLIRLESPKYLPHSRVDVAKVEVRPFKGEVTIYTLLISDTADTSPSRTVGKSPWIKVRFDPWAMMKGRFEARDVTVAKPTIRLARKLDGTWNFQGLLASPWPVSGSIPVPPITIQDGTVELMEEGAKAPLTLLRKVSIKIPASQGGSPVGFELTAEGEAGLFDRIRVEGTVDPKTGQVALRAGELVRLTLSKGLRDRLPAAVGRAFGQAGLESGEIDADLPSLTFDPAASPRIHYQATAKLRRGLWKCPKLPFPISDVSVNLALKDDELTILHGMGSDGSTTLSLTGKARLDLDDLAKSPFEIHGEASNFELDARIRRWIPEENRELWDAYFPQVNAEPSKSAGRVNIVANARRLDPAAKVDYAVDIKCLDVSMKYRHFAYPVDHIQGSMRFTPGKMSLKVWTFIGNQPLVVEGDVNDPGPNAEANLVFDVASLPIDDVLRNALPKEVRETVDRFKPTGSVRGKAKLRRLPPLQKGDDPRGRVTFDALIDLNPGCSVTWEGLTYPVMNLVGRLEIHPNRWIFRDMKGKNGQAEIRADGEVEKLDRNVFKVGVHLKADNLPFDDQLRNALPKPWQLTWDTLNPTGASDIEAEIKVDPGKPQHDRIVIIPRKATGVKLRFSPLAAAGGHPSKPIELRMDDVSGDFVYDTADTPRTSMSKVKFSFHGAKVKFESGAVDVKDNGQFNLGVSRLGVTDLRLDDELRRYMPPVMATNARRLKDDKIPFIQADLGLGWSGKVGESAWCRWENALVVLTDNKISAGTDLNLEYIEGQLDNVRGSFNGRDLDVHGKLKIDSISIFNQQISNLTANLDIENGGAKLDAIQAKILEGTLKGRIWATLDATPQYSLWFDVQKADLTEYARTQPGHQGFKGFVTAHVDLSGRGPDPHTITGEGRAEIVQGDLGTLPVALRLFNVLKPARDAKKDTKTAFDSAELAFTIVHGDTRLKPVKLVGNAFTLDGDGKIDVRGDIDVKLRILPGRDALHIPLLSFSFKELVGQILVVRVHGQATSPAFNLEPIPATGEVGKAIKQNQQNREIQKTGLVGPMRNGLDLRPRTPFTNRWFGPLPTDKVD